MGIRPEDIHDDPLFIEASKRSKIEIKIEVAELMGTETMIYSQIDNLSFIARVDARTDVLQDSLLTLAIDMDKVNFFD